MNVARARDFETFFHDHFQFADGIASKNSTSRVEFIVTPTRLRHEYDAIKKKAKINFLSFILLYGIFFRRKSLNELSLIFHQKRHTIVIERSSLFHDSWNHELSVKCFKILIVIARDEILLIPATVWVVRTRAKEMKKEKKVFYDTISVVVDESPISAIKDKQRYNV